MSLARRYGEKVARRGAGIGVAIGLAMVASNAALGNPSQSQHDRLSQTRSVGNHPQLGTEASPLVVETIPKPEPKAVLDREIAAEREKTLSDRKVVELTGQLTLFTGLLFGATAILAAITGGLVWVGFEQVRDARESIKVAVKAANVALAGQRPWVKIDFEIIGPLVFEDDVLRLPLRVTLTNVGNTPATSTMPWFDFCPPRGNFVPPHWFDGIKVARDQAKMLEGKIGFSGVMTTHGKTLFPKDTEVIPTQLRIKKTELDAAFTHTALPKGHVELIVSGIVSYSFGGGTGETPFVFRLVARDDEDRSWIISISDCPVPAEQLHLEEIRAGPQAT